jgi:hypothetical protein
MSPALTEACRAPEVTEALEAKVCSPMDTSNTLTLMHSYARSAQLG